MLRSAVGPALLLLICPIVVNAVAYCAKELGGSLRSLADAAIAEPAGVLEKSFPPPSSASVTFLALLLVLQLLLLQTVPGNKFNGPRTGSGHVPSYTDNGFASFWIMLAVLYLCCTYYKWFPPTIIYDELGAIMTTLNVGALALSFLLYVKGLVSPSTGDSGSSGSVLMDVYWGTELYPRVCDVDLKQLFIARWVRLLASASRHTHTAAAAAAAVAS